MAITLSTLVKGVGDRLEGYARLWHSAGPFSGDGKYARRSQKLFLLALKLADIGVITCKPNNTWLEQARTWLLSKQAIVLYRIEKEGEGVKITVVGIDKRGNRRTKVQHGEGRFPSPEPVVTGPLIQRVAAEMGENHVIAVVGSLPQQTDDIARRQDRDFAATLPSRVKLKVPFFVAPPGSDFEQMRDHALEILGFETT